MASRKKEQRSFEESLIRLERITERTEAADVGLEELISLVEEGMTLLHDCRKLLAQAELRIQKLDAPVATQGQLRATPTEQENDFTLL